MTVNEFDEMSRNDPRGALMALHAEVIATQETLIELLAVVKHEETPVEA